MVWLPGWRSRQLVGDERRAQLSAGARRRRWPGSLKRVGTMAASRTPDMLMDAQRQTNSPRPRSYRTVAEYHPTQFGVLIDAVFRQHIGQRPNLLRGRQSSTRRPSVTCGIGFADLTGFTALTQAAHTGRVVRAARRVRRLRQRCGARRRWTGGEVHRRRGDVGDLDPRPAGKGGRGPRGLPAGAGGRTAGARRPRLRLRCLPSAGTTSAIPLNLAARLVGAADPVRSWRPPTFATNCPTGQRFHRIR